MKFIGIDFGNYSIKIYSKIEDSQEIITNELNERTFRNIISEKNNKIYISHEVENNINGLIKNSVCNIVSNLSLDINVNKKYLISPCNIHSFIIIFDKLVSNFGVSNLDGLVLAPLSPGAGL